MANAADVRAEAETLRQMLTHCRALAVRCRVQELIDELEALARRLADGDPAKTRCVGGPKCSRSVARLRAWRATRRFP